MLRSSQLSHPVNSQKQPDPKIVNFIQQHTMSRKPETRVFKGGIIPSELKNLDSRGRITEPTTQWQGSSEREESSSAQDGTKDHPQKEKGEFKHGHTEIAKRGHFQGTRRNRSDRTKESGRKQEKNQTSPK